MIGDNFKIVLTVEEARRQLGISRGLMYDAIRRGQVPNIRIGRRILIPTAALVQLLQNTNKTAANSDAQQS